MKTLTLLRHAKSSWNDPVERDFDRPLNDRGRRAARVMGDHMRRESLRFDAVVVSPSVRTLETLSAAQTAFGRDLPHVEDRRIYLASSVTLLEVLRDCDNSAESVLLVGHNPGLEDLILDLVPDVGSNPMRDEVYAKFPTASLAVLECDVDDWASLDRKKARLLSFTRPRDLDPELGPEDE
jgi:phosphohistidine phosphatase